MFSFLGFVFFFILIILFFGLSIISGVLRALFGFGRRRTTSSNRSTSSNQNSDTTYEQKKRNARHTPKRKKVFEKDEGEYVDFEEIKDENPR